MTYRVVILTLLSLLLLISMLAALMLGAVSLPALDMLHGLMRLLSFTVLSEDALHAELILGQIRLPRLIMGVLVGAVLAVCGVAMQGLFRNPLADPGLVGVSSGAALGAALAIVGLTNMGQVAEVLSPYVLVVSAFLGGLIVTTVVYQLARREGEIRLSTMLLAGIALNALAAAMIGLLTYLADDATLRSLRTKQIAQNNKMPLILLGVATKAADGSLRMGVVGGTSVTTLTLQEVAGFTEGVGVLINNTTYPVTKAFIDQAHAAGLKVHGWTFAQADATLAAADFRKYLDMGMDGMFANYPDLAVTARNTYVQGK